MHASRSGTPHARGGPPIRSYFSFHRRFSLLTIMHIQYMPHVAGQLSRRFTQCRPHDQRTSSANCVRRPFELAAPALSYFLNPDQDQVGQFSQGQWSLATQLRLLYFWTLSVAAAFLCSRARTNVFRNQDSNVPSLANPISSSWIGG